MKRPSDSTLKYVSTISYAFGLLLWAALVILAIFWFNNRTIDGKDIEPITVLLGLIMPVFCDTIRYQENHNPQADPVDVARRDPEPNKAHGPKRMEEN